MMTLLLIALIGVFPVAFAGFSLLFVFASPEKKAPGSSPVRL